MLGLMLLLNIHVGNINEVNISLKFGGSIENWGGGVFHG
jgi:hypothetical protein